MYTTRIIGYDIQRELLRRTNGDNVPNIGDKPTMSAIEYNAVNLGNPNNHQHQHGATAAAIMAANPSANLLCNYYPPAAKRKKPNTSVVGEIQMVSADGRQIQARTVNTAALGATAVPISLTPARFSAEEFDPVKIFGELTSTGLATTSTAVIGTDGTFGTLLAAGFNTGGTSNLLDHTTRILSFAADGSRIEEALEIKRAPVTATKSYPAPVSAVQVPNSNRIEGHVSHASTKKTGTKGKKASKGSKSAASNGSADPSKSSTATGSPRRKLKSMSIEEKYYVLQRLLKPDVSQATICEEMQLNKSVVSRIWCDRFKIEELYKQGSGNRIKVKYMHNGPAHPKKRGHGKKAKALAKQAAASGNNKSTVSETAANTTSTVVTSVPTTTTTYHQTLQLQQPTFARPSLLGLYAASTESLNNLNVATRSYEPNNVQH